MGNGEQGFGERFKEAGVRYAIDGKNESSIYGATLNVRKGDEMKAEITLHRVLQGVDLPATIDNLTLTAKLARDCYEERRPGTFSIHLSRLCKISDDTNINVSDAVLGAVRYAITGDVLATIYCKGASDIL